MAEQPLAGLNIVITRPREQSIVLVKRIETLGGKPRMIPLLEIEALRDVDFLREQISHLNQTEIVIFISPNAVRFGMAAIRETSDITESIKVATIGLGSAKALHELGITNVIVPAERFDSEGLLAMPDLQKVKGRRVMIFRGDSGRELLGDTLKARGAIVEYVTCYLRSKPIIDVGALLEHIPDAITVTSSEALNHLWEMLGEEGKMRIVALPIFVQHPRIADAARLQGWQQVNVTESGDDGLMSGLIAWAQAKGKPCHE